MITISEMENFYKQGFIITPFRDTGPLESLQKYIKSRSPCDPVYLHELTWEKTSWLQFIESLTLELHRVDYIEQLIQKNIAIFSSLLGEDIDMQTHPHLRISRPKIAQDMVDWHRDSFYGNSAWELNIWIPIFQLGEGAGLLYAEGSHRIPSIDIQDAPQEHQHHVIEKGSLENRLGFAYAPKSDATLRTLEAKTVKCLRPAVGECIVFFGCGLHRAMNESNITRLSLDLRLKQQHAPTNTKPGYFRAVHRGVVARVVQDFLSEVNRDFERDICNRI